jgi:hypothetical protein
MTKKGNHMGFVTLEDLYGRVDLVIFPRVWEQVYHLVEIDKVLQAEGRIDASRGDPKVIVDTLKRVTQEELRSGGSGSGKKNEETPLPADEDELLEDFLPDLPFDEDLTDAFEPEDSADSEDETSDQDEDPENITPAESQPEDNPGTPISDDQAPDDGKGLEPSETRDLSEQRPGFSTPKRQNLRGAYHLYSPSLAKADPLPHPDQKPRCIYITLNSCGDKNTDVRRLRLLHDILVSRPGRDAFAFRVCENGCKYEIDFPNVTTGLTEPLIQKLEGLMGANNIQITQLT